MLFDPARPSLEGDRLGRPSLKPKKSKAGPESIVIGLGSARLARLKLKTLHGGYIIYFLYILPT